MGRQIHFQYVGRDITITTKNLNIISGNTFSANYGEAILFDNSSNTHIFNNVQDGGLGRRTILMLTVSNEPDPAFRPWCP
jgi:hypothetical protein